MPKILIIGATGQTGSHCVKHALNLGHKVVAIVRTVSKVPEEVLKNPNFEMIEGVFTDKDTLAKAIPGCDYVVSMSGDRYAKQQFMLGVTKNLIPLMREHKVKKLLFQAGGMSYDAKGELPLKLRIVRSTIGWFLGLEPMVAENDAVIKYLATECMDIDWIVTRPAFIEEKPARGKLVRTSSEGKTVTYTDLALSSLEILQDPEAVHTCDWITYA